MSCIENTKNIKDVVTRIFSLCYKIPLCEDGSQNNNKKLKV